jgi:hypothetical protein
VEWFDIDANSYREIPVDHPCETPSAIGDVAEDDEGKPSQDRAFADATSSGPSVRAASDQRGVIQ